VLTRIAQTRLAMKQQGVDALLVGASTDLRWLTTYQALPLERLTLLVLPALGEPQLIVPGLEEPRARASQAAQVAAIRPWAESEDPFALVATIAGELGLPDDATFAVQDQLWSSFLVSMQRIMPTASWRIGSDVLRHVRSVKTPDEVAALQAAGAAIDGVHAQVPELLRVGRTESEVGADIARLINASHDRVEFIIVASGPNGASPHHETSDRVLQDGDAIVVDIGGKLNGYCSDMTRNYVIGNSPDGYDEMHATLEASQEAGVQAGVAGAACQDVDRASRKVLDDAGYGAWFIHRTGHGIGVDVHEHPYMIEGNEELLVQGMAFSVEPGVYKPELWGARIEDIVVIGPDGPVRCNNLPHGAIRVDGHGNRL
jgi:Xaa-Pro aminopeptidase